MILLQKTVAKVSQDKLEGCLKLRLGRGEEGYVLGEIVPGERLAVRIGKAALERDMGGQI